MRRAFWPDDASLKCQVECCAPLPGALFFAAGNHAMQEDANYELLQSNDVRCALVNTHTAVEPGNLAICSPATSWGLAYHFIIHERYPGYEALLHLTSRPSLFKYTSYRYDMIYIYTEYYSYMYVYVHSVYI